MDGRDETLKDTEDTTLVQMEEVERAQKILLSFTMNLIFERGRFEEWDSSEWGRSEIGSLHNG
jgi:hypothetical protein